MTQFFNRMAIMRWYWDDTEFHLMGTATGKSWLPTVFNQRVHYHTANEKIT